MSTARDDDELEPLPEDFVIPDDASALARDRAAHRMSGLPTVDPILIRVILTLVIGFLCTFAMFMVVTSKQMICANETECAAAALSPLQTGLVLFTPLITAAAALLALKLPKSPTTRKRLLTAAIFVPIVCAIVYFTTLQRLATGRLASRRRIPHFRRDSRLIRS